MGKGSARAYREPAPLRALPGGRCPRCGGAGKPPRKRQGNPFLSARRLPALVCDDCGLDFEAEAPATPESQPPW